MRNELLRGCYEVVETSKVTVTLAFLVKLLSNILLINGTLSEGEPHPAWDMAARVDGAGLRPRAGGGLTRSKIRNLERRSGTLTLEPRARREPGIVCWGLMHSLGENCKTYVKNTW